MYLINCYWTLGLTNMNKKKIILLVCIAAILLLTAASAFLYNLTTCPANSSAEAVELYVDGDDTPDSVMLKSGLDWRFTAFNKVMTYKLRTGHYLIEPGESSLALYKKLRNGQQSPIRLTIPSVRTLDRLAGHVGLRLMMDSTEIYAAFRDSAFISELGYTYESLPSLFIPNTYEVYWDMSLQGFMQRMIKENKRFWNAEREAKAKSLGYSHAEISTLASIIDEETANNAEKPMVAGMYINRLKINMPLQADPTVKFALGDFSLRRIYFEHLKVDNPYNTYRIVGLPPGPIRIPSIAGLDAVLNFVEHPYLYMCAKEDFSGTHNFAVTYREHINNARRYSAALNKRNIR